MIHQQRMAYGNTDTVFHKIIECFRLEGTFRVRLALPPAVSRDIFHQTRLLRALSNPALNKHPEQRLRRHLRLALVPSVVRIGLDVFEECMDGFGQVPKLSQLCSARGDGSVCQENI